MSNRAKEQLKCRILIASVPHEQQGNRLGSDPGAWERAVQDPSTPPHSCFSPALWCSPPFHSLEMAKNCLQSEPDSWPRAEPVSAWSGGWVDCSGMPWGRCHPWASPRLPTSHVEHGWQVKRIFIQWREKNPCVGVTFEPNKDLVHRLWHSILGS